jgi:uncharacterized integral membrane protein
MNLPLRLVILSAAVGLLFSVLAAGKKSFAE